MKRNIKSLKQKDLTITQLKKELKELNLKLIKKDLYNKIKEKELDELEGIEVKITEFEKDKDNHYHDSCNHCHGNDCYHGNHCWFALAYL